MSIAATSTLQAIAYATGCTDSAVASGVYTITVPCATPTFNPVAGTYASAQTVTINTTTGGATIRYTTDGSVPSSTSGTVYSSAVAISANTTLQAVAYATGLSSSAVASGNYFIQCAAPTFTPAAGTFATSTSVTIATGTGGATIRYTTNGATPSETVGSVYSSPVSINVSTALQAIAYKTGMTDSNVTSGAYTIGIPLTAVTFTAAPALPQTYNTPITLTAIATGGSHLQYQFWVYNPAALPAWSQLRGYASAATYVWTPASAGSYYLSVTALDGVTGAAVNATGWYTVSGSALTALAVSASPTPPQPVNTPITFTAVATGGTNVQYQFWLYNASAVPAWTRLQAYMTTPTCVWTPSAPGNYLISVTAFDSVYLTAVNQMLWYTVGSPITLSVSTSPASPQPAGTPITIMATVTNAAAPQVQFWLYNANASPAWIQLQGYSSQATSAWTPFASGNYLLSVTARDAVTGMSVNQLYWYTVIPKITLSVSAAPALPQSVGTPITFTALASGMSQPLYQFWLYNAMATPAWIELQGYSSQATCAWKSTAPGNYLLSVTARDGATGMAANLLFWYTVNSSSGAFVMNTVPTP